MEKGSLIVRSDKLVIRGRGTRYQLVFISCLFIICISLFISSVNISFSQNNSVSEIIRKATENLQIHQNDTLPTVSMTSNQILKPDFTYSNIALLYAKPDNYKGATIDVGGKVFNFPGVGELQMYVGGDFNDNLVVYYDDTVNTFVSDDCIKTTGVVDEAFEGTNAFSASLVTPSMTANSIQKIDCAQVINPAYPIPFA